MPEKISLRDARGKLVSGHYDVSHGRITVTASDGRTKSAVLDVAMLNIDTLARSLLLLLKNEKRRTVKPNA